MYILEQTFCKLQSDFNTCKLFLQVCSKFQSYLNCFLSCHLPLTVKKYFNSWLLGLSIFEGYQHIEIFSLIYLGLFYYWDLKLKINKYWSWTHWLALMIFSSKVDLCFGHKDSLYLEGPVPYLYILSWPSLDTRPPFIHSEFWVATRHKDRTK